MKKLLQVIWEAMTLIILSLILVTVVYYEHYKLMCCILQDIRTQYLVVFSSALVTRDFIDIRQDSFIGDETINRAILWLLWCLWNHSDKYN